MTANSKAAQHPWDMAGEGGNMAPNQDSSALLALPPELRNRIYHMTFEDVEVNLPITSSEMSKLGLLLTCKRLHQECLGIFYRSVTFTVLYASHLDSCLGGLPKERLRLLRDIRFNAEAIPSFPCDPEDEDGQGRAMYAGEVLYKTRRALRGSMYELSPLQHEALKASIRLKSGGVLWTSMPVATYWLARM
ncbi:hypothetical protein LTR85_008207 [Meristemomyces frigidus]|nr:hypothetical protein LTR85_008207 [Meristemomyces frigidus]